MTPSYRCYHYACVDTDTFLAAAQLPTPSDSYLSMNDDLKAVLELYRKGYRFIRFSPDGEKALFEHPVWMRDGKPLYHDDNRP